MSVRISVALASYNGALYIRQQLDSILSQLSAEDEVIVVDDASHDDTVGIVRAFNDTRLHLHARSRNLGVTASFTEAISLCRGEIIFLADQDDVWLEGKVKAMLQAFEHNPAANIVISDASVIDAAGNQLAESYYSNRGPFTDSLLRNLIKSSFHGCLMAFRSRIRPAVLPLAPYHDVWIGLCNKILGGETIYIPHAYVAYRRHGANESAPLPWYRQITKRLGLVMNLLRRRPMLYKQEGE